MRCVTRIIILVVFLITFTSAQEKWERIFGGSGRDQAFSVSLTPDSGYIVAGLTASYPQKCYEMYVVKTDMYGDTIWINNYGSQYNDYCWSIAQAHGNGYLLLGATDSTLQTGPHDVYLIKINEAGDSLWSRIYGDTNSAGYTNDVGHEVHPTNDGGYILVGSTESYGAGLHDVYLIKIDSVGDTLWTRTYGTSYYESGESVYQTDDNGYIVAGTTYETGAGQQIYIIRTNSQGDTSWTKRYGGSGNEDVQGILQTQDKGFIFVGSTTSYGAGNGDLYLVRTDSLGNTLWTKTYGWSFPDWGRAIRQTSDGGYIIIGGTRTDPDPEYCFAWLLKTDSLGDTLWTRTKASIYGAANGTDVQQANDQGYIIAGITWQYGGSDDFLLIKTDPEGISSIQERKVSEVSTRLIAYPNPFSYSTTIAGHEEEIYSVYDIAGMHAGSYSGKEIGTDLPAGVYFIVPRSGDQVPLRVVKIK
jgi:hypothetical protein